MARKGRPTYEDILSLPDNVVGEILDGELVVSPRPGLAHGTASYVISASLFGPFWKGGNGGPGGWWFIVEPELHLHGDIVVPDIAGWRRERVPVMPRASAFEVAPDWVCETLSPKTARYDRGTKLKIYAREGVHHYWIVDPLNYLLEVKRLEDGAYTDAAMFDREDTLIRAEPFDAVELDLSQWWLPEPPER
jgi:Uma2 family endonuclease